MHLLLLIAHLAWLFVLLQDLTPQQLQKGKFAGLFYFIFCVNLYLALFIVYWLMASLYSWDEL
jgi:hypothetical protein